VNQLKIFGRPVRRYLASVPMVFSYSKNLVECIRLFESPFELLRSYVTRTSPRSDAVRLRSGLTITLSNDPLDIVTIFGLFIRGDYGRIERGSTVVDIGANIGVFTLYAVHCGAAKVHSYEPSAESFTCLNQNIARNNLSGTVTLFRSAVSKGPVGTTRFPKRSSVFNSIATTSADGEYDVVPLETLNTVVERMGVVDLIKMDCEGEEERIVEGADAATLARVDEIRLEYHLGRGASVRRLLEERGFRVTRWWEADSKGGIGWFERA
jgi:FkbM family methyltransferase